MRRCTFITQKFPQAVSDLLQLSESRIITAIERRISIVIKL